MPSREFDTQLLIDWKVDELDDCEHIVAIGEQHVDEFDYTQELVIRAPDDGRLWSIPVEFNNGAGWNSICGIACRSLGDDLKPEKRTHTGHEVEAKKRTITYYARVPDPEPVTMDTLQSLLRLVMAKTGEGGVFNIDLSDVPSVETLEKLTPTQRDEVAEWAATCHAEASDNDVEAGPCPDPLRSLLPDDHPYKTWRVS